MVPFGLVTAWRRAIAPTRRSPSSVKATTDGVVRPPSSLAITVGWPPSMTATTELVVPRSIPMILPDLGIWLPALPAAGRYASSGKRRPRADLVKRPRGVGRGAWPFGLIPRTSFSAPVSKVFGSGGRKGIQGANPLESRRDRLEASAGSRYTVGPRGRLASRG